MEDCVIEPRGPRENGPPILVGTVGPRMLRITMPHADMWNAWWTDFDGTTSGFAARMREVDAACEDVGRDPAEVMRTAALHLRLAGGVGREMGGYTTDEVPALTGSSSEIATAIAAFGEVGAEHVQLVVDPITRESIESLGEVLEILDA